MKRVFLFIFAVCSLSMNAADYAPVSVPAASMQSVNNGAYMSTGSTYRSTVYAVGSYSPSAYAPAAGPRRAPGTPTGESTYDPKNPQLAPIGDVLLPLWLLALAYAVWTGIGKHRRTT